MGRQKKQKKDTIELANTRRRDEARAKYRHQGGVLFSSCGEDGVSHGEELRRSLEELSKNFPPRVCSVDQFERLVDQFEGLDADGLKTALMLDGFIAYGYDNGTSDGVDDDYLQAIDDESEEVALRNGIVQALEGYCENVAALSQKIGSETLSVFRHELREIQRLKKCGLGYSAEIADEILRNIFDACENLEVDLAIHTRVGAEGEAQDTCPARPECLSSDVKGSSRCPFKIDLADMKVTIGAEEPIHFVSWQFLFLVLSLNGFEGPHKIWLEREESIDKYPNEAVKERYKWLSAYREKKERESSTSAESVRDVLNAIRNKFKKKLDSNLKILVVPSGSPGKKHYESVNVEHYYDLLWCRGEEVSPKCPDDLRKVLQLVS